MDAETASRVFSIPWVRPRKGNASSAPEISTIAVIPAKSANAIVRRRIPIRASRELQNDLRRYADPIDLRGDCLSEVDARLRHTNNQFASAIARYRR